MLWAHKVAKTHYHTIDLCIILQIGKDLLFLLLVLKLHVCAAHQKIVPLMLQIQTNFLLLLLLLLILLFLLLAPNTKLQVWETNQELLGEKIWYYVFVRRGHFSWNFIMTHFLNLLLHTTSNSNHGCFINTLILKVHSL